MIEEEGTGSMTLWVLCEHGEKGPHPMKSGSIDLRWFCPGGREASIEDLKEALRAQGFQVYPPPQPSDYIGDDHAWGLH